MIAYEYSAVNRLSAPHHYMYAKYEGRPFLLSYRAARRSARERLLEQVERGLARCPSEDQRRMLVLLPQCQRLLEPSTIARLESQSAAWWDARVQRGAPLKDEAGGGWIETSGSLEALLDLLCQGSEGAREAIRATLNRYVARFEVTKRLCAAYHVTGKESRGPHDDMNLYASLSLALLLYQEQWKSLKFLNTALKVNDLLCSMPPAMFTTFAALASCASLRLEQEAIDQLMAEKGIGDGA